MAWWWEAVAVAVFFGAYLAGGVYVAAGTAVGLAAAELAWSVWRRVPVSAIHATGSALVILFGTLTVVFHDETFIKVKPTLLYWVVAAVLAHRLWRARGTPGPYLVQQLVPQAPDFIVTSPAVWRTVDAAWAAFFAVLGAVNWLVAARVSTDAWVKFKVFGVTALLAAAIFTQTIALHAVNEYDLAADLAAQRRRQADAAAAAAAEPSTALNAADSSGAGPGKPVRAVHADYNAVDVAPIAVP